VSKRLRLLVSGTLLGWLAWHTDWPRVGHEFAHVHIAYWVAAVVLYILTQLISARRWQLLARPLGFGQPFTAYVRYYFIGMYFNLFLPTSVGGDVVRAWYLAGHRGPRLAAFLSTFADRFSGLVVLVGMACTAVLVCPVTLPRWVVLTVWGSAGLGLIGLIGLSLFSGWLKRYHSVRHLLNGVRIYAGKHLLLLSTTGLSILVQAGNVVLVWLVGQAIGVQLPSSFYWIFVPMVSLLTLLPISINGLGVREWGVVLFLAPFQVEAPTAVSLSFLWFLVFTAASLIGGGVYLLDRSPGPEVRSDDESVGGDPHQGRAGELEAAGQPSASSP
jgi:uncharacterized membrane protein YbhN (UPF0104 family)